MCSSDLFLGLIAILFPPLSVWVKRGICSADSLINILLCSLGFIPGLLHAWYIIAKYPEPESSYETIPQDAEAGGRITYVIVQTPGGGERRVKNYGGAGNGGYGTNAPMDAPTVRQEGDGTWSAGAGVGAGEGSASAAVGRQGQVEGASATAGASADGDQILPPPTYQDAVKGDHKVQTRD